jgi:hypothetical protein
MGGRHRPTFTARLPLFGWMIHLLDRVVDRFEENLFIGPRSATAQTSADPLDEIVSRFHILHLAGPQAPHRKEILK